MEEQEKDPFAEFGGTVVTAKEDPFKEFGGVVVPKKPTPSGGPNTLQQLGNGFDISQPSQAPTSLIPVLPENRPAVKQQQVADAKQHDRETKELLNSKQFADELAGRAKSRAAEVAELETNPNADYYVQKREDAERERYKGPITMSDRIHSVTGDIYGGLGTMGKGLVRSAGAIAKLITPDAIGSDERFDYDVNKVNEVIDKAVNFGQRDGEISPEKKAAINKNPINGLISGLAEFAPAIATAESTGGMSFFFNDYEHGYENIDKADKENNLGLSEAQKQLYATAQGTASALLMSHNLHSLLGNASEKTTKGLIDKISLDAMENMAKSGEDFTGANLKKAVDVQLQTLEDKVKNFGVKAVVGTSKSIGDMAALEGAKIATDKLANTATGKKVFDMENQAERMQEAIKTGALFGAAGAIMKAPAMLAKGSLERNSVIESIYKDPSLENIERIKTTVADRFRDNPEDGQPTIALIDQIQGVAKALPKGLPLDKQIRATDLIMERKGLELAKEQNAESNKGMDPVFGDQHAVQDTAYQDRIDSINDKIKSIASDKPVKYFKDEEGQPMKQFGDEEPEKITENRYYTEKPHLAEERKVKVEEPVVEETITEPPTEPIIDEPATPSPETPADVQGQPEQPVSTTENSVEAVETPIEEIEQARNQIDIEPSNPLERPDVIQNIPELRSEQPETIAENKSPAEPRQEAVSQSQGDTGSSTKPERQPSLNEQELNRKLELRKKFAGRFNDVTNIPTLLADKEFREYAGLVLKEATGDFKAFSQELIDNIGEKIKPHLDKLFSELSEDKTRPSKNEEMGDRAFELGIELKDAKEKSRGEDVVEKEASAKIKDGYDVYELIDKIVKDKQAATDTEVAILNKYIDIKEADIKTYNERLGKEGATMGKKDFIGLMDAKTKAEMEFQDAAYAAERTGRITAQALNARKFRFNKEDSLSNMVGKKRQALGGERLTPEQMADITAKNTEMESLLKAKDARLKKLESDNAKLKAEQTVKRVVAEKPKTGVTKEYLAKEREAISAEFSEKLKAMRSQGLNSAGKASLEFLTAAAPYVAKMTHNLAQEGVLEIKELVRRIKKELDLGDLEDTDIMDMVAGKYNEKKQTKTELQDNIRSLRTQAKLVAEIERLENGIKTDKPEVVKKKNAAIEELRARLKQLNNEDGEIALSAFKKRIQGSIEKLSKRIADGDYSKEEKKAPLQMDEEAKTLQRKYDSIKHDFELQIARDYLEQRTKTQKLIDDALNVTGVPRALKSSFDLSAAGRQGLFLLPHVKESTTALKQMFSQMTSEERYNNWMSDLKHDPMYDLMKESGLYIADKNDPKLSAREEEFTSNLAEKIPFGIGAGVKASERAYTGYLNVIRTGVFKSEATKLMERGYTYENAPKEFTSLARVVNILSGRGEIPKSWGHTIPKVLSLGLFSPRFMAARIQTLYLWADPSLSKNAKILAAKDVGSVLGSAATLLGMATMAGYSVNFSPTSTNFLKIEDKNENGSTYYDILGGLPQYVRFLSQMSTGKRISASGNETDLWAEKGPTNPSESTPGDVITSFLRGKISPVPGMLINLAFRKDVVGQPYGFKNVPYDFLAPLPLASLQEAYKVGGIDNALKVLIPSTIGIGVSSYNPNEKKEDTAIKKLKLPGGNEYELNETQVAERQKLNDTFIEKNGDRLTKAFTRKAEGDRDLLKKIRKKTAGKTPEEAKVAKQKVIDEYVERHIKTLANKNSMPYIYKKYKKDLKPIDE